MVEFMLLLPLLLVLLLGIADFSRVFHAGVVVESASREAEAAALEYLRTEDDRPTSGDPSFNARSYGNDPYKGLLIWQAEGTSRTYPTDTDFANDKVRIAGVGDLSFWGLIYGPKSLIELQGNGMGTGTAGVQVLSWRFDIGGNASLDMPLDPNELPGRRVKGLVH